MEGNIYLCKQNKLFGVYSLELIENPKIKAKGTNLELCKEDICMQIIEWNGDGEAVLELLPTEFKRTASGIDAYRRLDYNDTAELLNTNYLYSGGMCPKCKYAKGKRVDELLNLEYMPKGKKMILGVNRRRKRDDEDFPRLFPVIEIFNKEFISLLTKEEKELFELRDVLYKGKRSDYVEIIPKKVIKNCSHIEADYNKHPFIKNWRCTECGKEELHFWTKEYNWNNNLVDLNHIKDFPSIFFLDTGLHISLCIRNDRWVEINKHIKVTTSPVIVLNKEFVEYPDFFEEPEEFEW